jgi:hypothetical protein
MSRVKCDWRFPRSLHTLYGYFVPIVDTLTGLSPVLRRMRRWGKPTLLLGLAVPRTVVICDLGNSTDLALWLSERSEYISAFDLIAITPDPFTRVITTLYRNFTLTIKPNHHNPSSP